MPRFEKAAPVGSLRVSLPQEEVESREIGAFGHVRPCVIPTTRRRFRDNRVTGFVIPVLSQTILRITARKWKGPKTVRFQGLILVGATGFEPATPSPPD